MALLVAGAASGVLFRNMRTLDRTYLEIASPPTGGPPSRATFELVDQMIREQGEVGIAHWVVDSSPSNIPWESVAEVLAIMMWSTSDNGSGILRDAERWLTEGGDERRIFVALNLDVYPFQKPNEMVGALKKAAQRFPRLDELCIRLITERSKLAE